ncbi:YibE/F family protein [Weissella ceti]|uniref:YibE/F family protein n=2 Tax=Weissella ceti TaxID=759620 RepID=A0ABT3E618_9LACO|nr:YibE/F family protein [Weissella ceti]MCW0953855.1 YibE/F family protein [Weissella ceti]QVK12589.1 YibE/F family protein [Weissella ceti]
MTHPIVKRLRPWLLLILVTLGAFLFLKHDTYLYQQPVATITEVKTTEASDTSDQFGNQVQQFDQAIKAKIMNGSRHGTMIQLNNQYDSSLALTTELKAGQQLFIREGDKDIWQIQNTKRDYIWLPILVFILGLMVILFGKSRQKLLISTLMNVCLFILFIFLDLNLGNSSIFAVFIGFAILATLLTTGILLGFRSHLTWIINATVLTTGLITTLLALIVFWLTNEKGIYYEHMDFVTQDPASLFLAVTLVGLLGALLDEATDMTVAIDALVQSRPDMSWQAIVQAGREIGQTIFGSLNNVLLLIFMAEQIPLAILYLRNGNSWDYTFAATLSLGLIQTLISAIGIVLTVPIGLGFILIFRRWSGGKL